MKHHGFIIWKGPSQLTGEPILLIATRGAQPNTKTGRMIQTYILRSHVSPIQATHTGQDTAICGNCPHKPTEHGTCYVRIDTGPTQIYKALKRGRYPRLTLRKANAQCQGSIVRMGSYGDPCAVPFSVWTRLLNNIQHTGYTHQWRAPKFAPFKSLCMASTDSLDEYTDAIEHGWRAFTILKTGEAMPDHAFLCPASAEAGHKLTCAQCLACNGHATGRTANVAIPVHGVAFKQARFNQLITIRRAQP